MARKVIIDCDPGIDDAVALCLALFDPRLDVAAVTAVAGKASGEQATRNVQSIIERLDPPRFPRLGAASDGAAGPGFNARLLHGDDGLGNAQLAVSTLQHLRPAEKILSDEIRGSSEPVTVVTLGPLTNLARAFRRDQELPGLVNRLIIMGGAVNGVGNVTPAAEFNIHCDPASAQEVFRAPCTKTLIPLDVTSQVVFTLDLLDKLPDETTRAGSLLRKILPYSFRVHHQRLGLESVHLHDAVALLAALEPGLFEFAELAGDVETGGFLTTGATVFDRRANPDWRPNMEVALSVQVEKAAQALLAGLRLAGESG